MKAYILAVCGAALISALVTVLLPEGKTGKFINGILKLFCLLVMLVPLLALFTGGEGALPSLSGQGTMEYDDAFIEKMFARRAEAEAASLESYIDEEFSVTADVRVGWENVEYEYTVSEVLVTVEDFGIYADGEHIFIIEQIAEDLSGTYKGAEVTVR